MYAPSTDADACPVGTYNGKIAQIEYVGKQRNSFEGREKIEDQVLISVEVDKRDEAGTRFVVSKSSKLSSHPKSWIAKVARAASPGITDAEIKVTNLLSYVGRPVMCEVGHTAGGRDKITGLSPLMEGLPEITLEGDYSAPSGLAEWLRGPENSKLVKYDPSVVERPSSAAQRKEAEAAAQARDDIPY